MKKIFGGILLATMAFGISLINVSHTVEAKRVCGFDDDIDMWRCWDEPDSNVGESWTSMNGPRLTTDFGMDVDEGTDKDEGFVLKGLIDYTRKGHDEGMDLGEAILTPVDRNKLPVPTDPAWEKVADGVKTSGPGIICISTRGAQFGWDYEIFKVSSANSLSPLESITGHYPSEEGPIITCANAVSAGTYGIYGMFTGVIGD